MTINWLDWTAILPHQILLTAPNLSATPTSWNSVRLGFHSTLILSHLSTTWRDNAPPLSSRVRVPWNTSLTSTPSFVVFFPHRLVICPNAPVSDGEHRQSVGDIVLPQFRRVFALSPFAVVAGCSLLIPSYSLLLQWRLLLQCCRLTILPQKTSTARDSRPFVPLHSRDSCEYSNYALPPLFATPPHTGIYITGRQSKIKLITATLAVSCRARRGPIVISGEKELFTAFSLN